MTLDRRARFAWAVLAFNAAVVLFGAVVRATGSGAGCGGHWPDCNGGALPLSGTPEEAIEFTHRVTSGTALILVLILAAWVWRSHAARHRARWWSAASALLVIDEALIGAVLVLFGWTGENASTGRAVSISLHLVNTLLLLAALAITAWVLSGREPPRRPLPGPLRRPVVIGLAGLLIVGVAGAITALGDTLFPAESVLAGVRADFTGTFLVRLRWLHPIAAVAVGFYLLLWLRGEDPETPTGRRLATALAALVGTQLLAGGLNVVLLAPVWMQVVHLLLADAVWLTFVLYVTEAVTVARRRPAVPAS